MKNRHIWFAILFTAVLLTGYVLVGNRFTIPVWKPLAGSMLGLILLAAAGFFFRKTLYPRYQKQLQKFTAWYRRMEDAYYAFFSEKSFFFQHWLLLSVFYIPAYLALFPGTFGYDGPEQAAQYFGEIEMTAHHPVAHTWLLGFFLSAGNRLFHSFSTGLALYTAFQGLVVTGSLAYSLAACKRHRVPLIWIVVGFLWAGLNPFLQILTFSSTKDILFGAFLLCFTVSVWNAAECNAPKKADRLLLILFGVLTCLFRNQGIYIVAALLCFMLLLRAGKKQLNLSLIAIFLISEAFFLLCGAGLHIPKGDKREMLCVPMQQMARVVSAKLNGGNADATPLQIETLEELIPREGILSYSYTSADPVKSYFRTDVLLSDFGKYGKLYLSLMKQNPMEYLLAWNDMFFPYWDMASNDYRNLAYTASYKNNWEIYPASLSEKYDSFLRERIDAPEYHILTRPESCLWLLALLSGFAIALRRKGLFVSILPLALYFGTILLGPVALLRYLYPLTLATPLLFGMFFSKYNSSSHTPINASKVPTMFSRP